MKFTLRERTPQEIEDIKNEHRFYARMVKGNGYTDVCPLEVTLANGRKKNVWALSENQIISLMDHVMAEMTPKGMKDQKKTKEAFKILECWREKHGEVSVDFVEKCLNLETKYNEYVGTVRDLTTQFISRQVNNAKVIADYLNGMSGDKTEITNDTIIKILRNQEQIRENRKSKNANV